MKSFISQPNETPEQKAKRRQQMIAQALITPPTSVGDGLSALGSAIAYRSDQQGAAFPVQPGSGQASFGASLGNLLTGRRNGGLY